MFYRAVTPTLEGFIQQLACCYLTHGYWFYVSGFVPEGKDPAAVDANDRWTVRRVASFPQC